MQDTYIKELTRYKHLLKQQRVTWLFVAVMGVLTVVASEYVSINDKEGIIYLAPLILLFILLVVMGHRLVFYKCPKCKKHMTTKYLIVHSLNAKACIHCGLEIFQIPEHIKNRKKCTGDEWLQ